MPNSTPAFYPLREILPVQNFREELLLNQKLLLQYDVRGLPSIG